VLHGLLADARDSLQINILRVFRGKREGSSKHEQSDGDGSAPTPTGTVSNHPKHLK
jgi:hypothetical protein